MLVWLSGSAQPNAFLDIFKSSSYSGASIAFHIVDVNSKETLEAHNQDLIVVPASIQKLITTATALEVLGEDFRYTTQLFHSGKIQDSILYGNLIIIGAGDPSFASRYFQGKNPFEIWADSLLKKGIKSIEGDLIVDASHYDEEQIPDTWIWGDIGNYFGTGISAMNYSDNTVFVDFSSKQVGSLTTINSITPKCAGLVYENRVVAADIRSDQAYIFGAPKQNERYIQGQIPQNRGSFKVKGSVPNPALFAGYAFLDILKENGIYSSGNVYLKQTKTDSVLNLLAQHQSPSLGELVYQTNQHSINLFAEGLLREVGLKLSGKSDFTSCTEAVKAFWAKKGLYTQSFFMEDGSGLSRFNGVSAKFMTDILVQLKGENTFINSFPIAGISGTLSNLLKGTFAENNLRAKSGSMERVRSYAGFVKSKSGKGIAFCVIVNNYNGSSYQVRKDLEEFMRLIALL